jgi:hypothetical protein
MIVYVLEDNDYDSWIAGVFSSEEKAKEAATKMKWTKWDYRISTFEFDQLYDILQDRIL